MNLKRMIPVAILMSLFSSSAFSLPETNVYKSIVGHLENGHKCETSDQDFWKRKVIETPLKAYKKGEKYRLRYSKFGCSIGEKGSIMIAPGRSEGSPEYYETAIDYIGKGYSPVYVVDHRGQGLSPRVLKNTHKGHVADFMNYVSDFDHAVDSVLSDLKSMGRDKVKNPLFFTSNSMGAAIGLGYFMRKGDANPFSAAAFFGSMIRVNYLSFVNKEPTVLNNLIYSEQGVIGQGKLACLRGKCDLYSRPKVFGDYKAGSRNFVEQGSVEEMEKFMTHSKARYDLRTYLWDKYDWSKIIAKEYSGENWKGPHLGGATFNWTLATTKFLKKMRKKSSIKKLPKMPIFIMTGTRDLRAYKPHRDGTTDLSRHKKFCDSVNKHNVHQNKKMCQFQPLEEAFHEIYKDSDNFRSKAMHAADKFFQEALSRRN